MKKKIVQILSQFSNLVHMVGSAFYYIRDVFFKWELYYEADLSSCILGFFWPGSLFTLHQFYARQLHECPGHCSHYTLEKEGNWAVS